MHQMDALINRNQTNLTSQIDIIPSSKMACSRMRGIRYRTISPELVGPKNSQRPKKSFGRFLSRTLDQRMRLNSRPNNLTSGQIPCLFLSSIFIRYDFQFTVVNYQTVTRGIKQNSILPLLLLQFSHSYYRVDFVFSMVSPISLGTIYQLFNKHGG